MKVVRFVIAALFAIRTAIAADSPSAPPAKTLLGVLEEAGCATMIQVIEAAGLTEKLSAAGPFTVFAPTDEAFGRLTEDQRKRYLDPARREHLARWVGYFIVEADMHEADLLRSRRVPTLSGEFLTLWISPGAIKIDRLATVLKKQIPASNGFVYTLDQVIEPPRSED